jgi:hypothetical protein
MDNRVDVREQGSVDGWMDGVVGVVQGVPYYRHSTSNYSITLLLPTLPDCWIWRCLKKEE